MQTIGLTTAAQVEVISAVAVVTQEIPSVATEPGWFVVGGFFLPASARVQLEAIGCVAVAGIVLRVRLFDLTAGAPVAGAVAVIASTSDARAITGLFDLAGGDLYQFQAEAVGPSGFGVVRSASLVT